MWGFVSVNYGATFLHDRRNWLEIIKFKNFDCRFPFRADIATEGFILGWVVRILILVETVWTCLTMAYLAIEKLTSTTFTAGG